MFGLFPLRGCHFYSSTGSVIVSLSSGCTPDLMNSSVCQVVFHSAVLSYISRGGAPQVISFWKKKPASIPNLVGRKSLLMLRSPRWRVILSLFSCVGCLSIHLGKCLFKRHLFKAEYGSTYVSSQHSEQILFLLFGDYLIGVGIPWEICIVQ